MVKNEKVKECLPKLSTCIRGLDKLLYGGVNVNTRDGNILIVIKGDIEDNDKTLLGIQLLYGIAQSVEDNKGMYKKWNRMNNHPVMCSANYKPELLQELFLDYFIFSGMQEIWKKKASKDSTTVLISTKYAQLLFDCEEIKCRNVTPYKYIPFGTIEDRIDSLIGDGIVYYNNRTNSLHFKVDGDEPSITKFTKGKKVWINFYRMSA